MKTLLLSSALAVAFIASPVRADDVTTLGGSSAQSCYFSASADRHDNAAIAECTEALQLKSLTEVDRAGTLVNRGILYMHSGRQDFASTDYDRAIALDPDQPEAWLNKAVLMVNAGNGASAIELADRALQLHTEKPALAYYVRGLAHEEQGQIQAAYADLRNAHALAPNWSEPTEQLKRYRVVSR